MSSYPLSRRQACAAALAGLVLPLHAAAPLALRFRDTEYVHRWSRQGQHEFTPPGDTDLARWNDMLTLNLHTGVAQGEQLAGVANQVLANYQRHGKILQTRSKPRTAQSPAEHLIVAVLGTPALLEAAFARCQLHDGMGLVTVVSHRIHGQAVGPAMSSWLQAHGAAIEQALMAWSPPPLQALQRLRAAA
jgi:hypothetical protein